MTAMNRFTAVSSTIGNLSTLNQTTLPKKVLFAGDAGGKSDADSVELSAQQDEKIETEKAEKKFVSTLALKSNEQQFVDKAKSIFEPFSNPEYAQKLDEEKRPPLEILHALTREKMNVLGLPVPPLVQAKPLINNPDFRSALGRALEPAKVTHLVDWGVLGEKGKPTDAEKLFNIIGPATRQTLSAVEMSRMVGAGVTTFLGVNGGLAAEAIGKIATPEQSAFWLNAINEGKITSAFGLTEENFGSDPRSMETTFKKVEKDGKTTYILNGNKKYIGNAAQVIDASGKLIHPGADFIVVFAVDDQNKAPEEKSFRAFMVPRSAIGEENIRPSGKDHNKMGLREVNNGDFDLIDVEVPEEFLLGKPGEDIYPTLLGALDETRLFVGAMGLGMAKAAIEIGEEYASQRNQYGRAIEGFQAIRFPLKELKAKTLAAELLVMHAAGKIDKELSLPEEEQHSTRYRTDTSMAKLLASEVAEDATRRALKTMGGKGFMEDPAQNMGIAKRLRDVTVIPIYEGTSEIQKNVIAQGVLIRQAKKSPKNQILAFSDLQRKKLSSQMALGKMIGKFRDHPIEVNNAVFQYAFADFSLRYANEVKDLTKEWRAELPVQYEGWDKKSLKREKGLVATLLIQKRMHILADISTTRQAAYLAHREVRYLENQENLNAEQEEKMALLKLYMQISKEEMLGYYQELRGEKLELLETDPHFKTNT